MSLSVTSKNNYIQGSSLKRSKEYQTVLTIASTFDGRGDFEGAGDMKMNISIIAADILLLDGADARFAMLYFFLF